MGITVQDPMEESSKFIDYIDKAAKMSESMGAPYVPPVALIAQWPKKMFGQEYPMDSVMDPTTGQTISKPREWRPSQLDTKQFQSKLTDLIKQTFSDDFESLDPTVIRQYITDNLNALMGGPGWETRYPDRALLMEQTFKAYGLETPQTESITPTPPVQSAKPNNFDAFMEGLVGLSNIPGMVGKATGTAIGTAVTSYERSRAPKAPAAPPVTPMQRAAYNTARAAGKSPEESRRLAGF